MPWKDDSKSDAPGPWEAPGAAVAPPPKPSKAAKPPRPWDDGDADTGADAPAKRPRLAVPRRPRPPAEPAAANRIERGPAKTPRQSTARGPKPAPKLDAPVQRGPDLDALKRHLSQSLADRFGGAHGRRLRMALGVGAVLGALAGWAASGVYRVAPDQAAVVQRFGAFVGETGPGLHYHLPWPLAQARRVPIGAPQRADGAVSADDVDASAQMLAADGAPVEVSYALSWRVADPQRYLFHVADAPELLRALAEGAVRRAVGAAPLKTLLAGDRGAVETAALATLQQNLDRLGAGVQVTALDLRGVDPADAAQGAARDLATAAQDAHAAQADASAYRDRMVAQARGEAAKALQEAKGVADQEVAEAKGEADRFSALDAAYRQAPDATRERLYTETMERVLKAADKVIVDAPKGSTIVLPGSVVPQHGADASSAAPAAQPSAPPAAAAPGSQTPAAQPPATQTPATQSPSGAAAA